MYKRCRHGDATSNAFVDDKPTFRNAVNGPDKANWFAAMDREHANLTNHDAYTEV